jgi:hypothetical protein
MKKHKKLKKDPVFKSLLKTQIGCKRCKNQDIESRVWIHLRKYVILLSGKLRTRAEVVNMLDKRLKSPHKIIKRKNGKLK